MNLLVPGQQKYSHIFQNKTFSLVVHILFQVYVIYAERKGFVLHVIYALLPNKTEARLLCQYNADPDFSINTKMIL
ncbi:hypothetical protein MXB_1640 [Myxobolus squamalis]|nr:hypothetical protein MXB_1640 [Myxobolus squamalis]